MRTYSQQMPRILNRWRQIERQLREIRDPQRAGVSTVWAEELLARMLAEVDELCAERDRWWAGRVLAVKRGTFHLSRGH